MADKSLADVFGRDKAAVDIADNFGIANSREGQQKVVAAMSAHGGTPRSKLGDMRPAAAMRVRKPKVVIGSDPEPE